MPRTYIRTKIKKYTPQDLAEAIEKVKNGELTQYSAAQLYNIPTTTLHGRIMHGKTTRPNAGRPTAISFEEEKKLAETIIIMEKWGFGLSRFEIMELVSEYVRVNNIQTPFKNNIPGPDWFINFKKRFRLSIKKAQSVEFVRRKMTDPFVIAEYFDLLENTLQDLNLFESPQFIWNLDETSLCMDPSRTKVVGQINKPCARTTHGSGKENITVLAGASASGKKLPPLVVYKGKFVWDQWMAELDNGQYDFELSYAASPKGWMTTDIFYNYLEKVLIPSLGEERPVLIIYDGHSTHVDVRVVNLAILNRVTILKLPPHTSHLLQPLDISVFKSFKTTWDAKLVEWQRRNIGTKMPKKVFAQTLADTWQQTKPDIIQSGFKKAGIHPFNAQVIPMDKYDPDAYKRYQKKISEAHLAHTQLNTKNPKSLKHICIDLFNNYLPKTNDDSLEKSTTDNVTLLSQMAKTDVQTLSFIAKQPIQIPICLESSKSTQRQTQNLPKINIISNIIIKKASQPPLQAQPIPKPSCTFEELILRKIQQDKKDTTLTKKKRITRGAEVITATMGKNILEENEKTKSAKAITKTKQNAKKTTARVNKINKSAIPICTAQKEEEQPHHSGIKNKKKRKRQPSIDSITSISDFMSEYSDSDTIDCVDFEELTNEELYNSEDDDRSIKTKGVKYVKKNKRCENFTDEKILTNKDSNFLCITSSSVGKQTSGKENKVDKKEKEEQRQVERDDENDVDVFIKEKNVMIREDSKEKDKDEQLILELENYKRNDSVLVRYFIRKKWRYYIGFIEEVIERDELYFSVNFLKTARPHQQLTFMTTKRKDSDKVPLSLIVKKIDIQKKSNDEKEFFLCNDEDTVYFD